MTTNALIIVDMLNDFIDEKGALYCGETAAPIVPFIKRRLEEARSRGDLVIFLKDSHDEDDAEFEKFPNHCVAGTWGSEIIPDLSPAPGEEIVEKKRYSGFYGTRLSAILEKAGVKSAAVVGVCTSICVMDTVGGLANRDLSVTVHMEGVADFDPEFHDFALRRMERLYGADVR